MTLLWRNFSGCVFANSKLRLFINFYFWSECRWRVQPAAARFNKMHGALRAFHVSLNDASTRTGHKWVKRNNGHLLTLQIWAPWKFMSGERRTKLFLNLYPKPKTVSELKVALEKMGQLSAGSINKSVPGFRNSLTRVREWWWKTLEQGVIYTPPPYWGWYTPLLTLTHTPKLCSSYWVCVYCS